MLQVSTPLASASARRSRQFHERIAAIHAHKVMKGIDPSPFWPGMWMWDLVVISPKQRRTSLDEIAGAVCDFYGVTRPELFGSSRHANTVRARHVACYLAVKCTRFSSLVVGKKFHRDHTVILYAQRKIEHRIARDALLAGEVKDLLGRLS